MRLFLIVSNCDTENMLTYVLERRKIYNIFWVQNESHDLFLLERERKKAEGGAEGAEREEGEEERRGGGGKGEGGCERLFFPFNLTPRSLNLCPRPCLNR